MLVRVTCDLRTYLTRNGLRSDFVDTAHDTKSAGRPRNVRSDLNADG